MAGGTEKYVAQGLQMLTKLHLKKKIRLSLTGAPSLSFRDVQALNDYLHGSTNKSVSVSPLWSTSSSMPI